MQRYFVEVAYKGTRYSGFQVQENADTVQFQVTRALETFYRQKFELTGSSRTDAGVHALQNFFHFDCDPPIQDHDLYNINSILPPDIVLKAFYKVSSETHSRFSATEREYKYYIFNQKDPFLSDRAWYYPYKLDINLLHQAADIIKATSNFTSFSKRKTQVNNFICSINQSQWLQQNGTLVYHISGNRFLRGMVRALVATMLKLARKNITLIQFHEIINSHDNTKADFSAPSQGLFLVSVKYPQEFLQKVQ
jgi:tRNA pseudouridine38-40 synthase